MQRAVLIQRISQSDKEFHFQNWMSARLDDADLQHDFIGRNSRLEQVGELVRTETEHMVVGYSFELRTNKLTPQLAPNPAAGQEHRFTAYRVKGQGSGTVTMKDTEQVDEHIAVGGDE